MRKIIIIILLGFVLAGCSTTRAERTATTTYLMGEGEVITEEEFKSLMLGQEDLAQMRVVKVEKVILELDRLDSKACFGEDCIQTKNASLIDRLWAIPQLILFQMGGGAAAD